MRRPPTNHELNLLACTVDELVHEQYGLNLGVMVLVDEFGGYRVASPDTQIEVARTLRALLERIETELAQKSTPG